MDEKLVSTAGTGVVLKYGVKGVNENRQHLVDICAERGLFLSNTSFQHKMIHRYTWARGNDRSLIDYSLFVFIWCCYITDLPGNSDLVTSRRFSFRTRTLLNGIISK